ncbi:MAG TPA: ribonuclease HI [Clostridiales bacterium]|jgi:ribonuclease HI|nr:ribonuclease HI [Clostridiales bacterium]
MTDRKTKPIYLFTDGACRGNQSSSNLGGWGCILEYGEHRLELFGGEPNTTNNRMEMTALIKGVQAIKKPRQTVMVFADSSYLINGLRERWFDRWQSTNWLNSRREPVENRDLWELLIDLLPLHNFSFFKIKGHVNLNSKKTDRSALYKKFTEINGDYFKEEDFLYFLSQNARADELANQGIDSL